MKNNESNNKKNLKEYKIVRTINGEEYINLVADRSAFLNKINESIEEPNDFIKASYLVAVTSIVDIMQWALYTNRTQNQFISFQEVNNYVSNVFGRDKKLLAAIQVLIDIRCKFAHNDYMTLDSIFNETIIYLNQVNILYNSIDLILRRDKRITVITEMKEVKQR